MSGLFDLGDVAVIPIVETPRLLIAPDEFFPDVPIDRAEWCFQEPWFDVAAGRLVYTIQSFLVVTPTATVLVDACVGGGKPRLRPEFADLDAGWLTALHATGTTPLDVTSVVLTHLHVDHVGWCTQAQDGAWEPVFRNARHIVTGPELTYWTGAAGSAAMRRTGDYMADSVAPLLDHGLLDLVDADATVAPGIRLEPASGHTPGNVVVRVTGSAGELLLAGDALHHPLQLRHPEVSTRYCVDPAAAAATRGRLLADAAASGTPVVPAHFPFPTAGRVEAVGAGYVFRAASDLLRTG
jgi:glyoxylase-like metal-dependent hydrolase (beta-lactamase superfamily II)